MKFRIIFLTFLCAINSVSAEETFYRSIDQNSTPVWDEYVPTIDKVDYSDKYNTGEFSDGEWSWWNVNDIARPDKAPEKFWSPEIDYNSFEEYSTRENLDNKGMILSDKRSCPYNDSIKCKEWLASPHEVESLPSAIGYVPQAREKTLVETEIEDLLKAKKTRADKKAKTAEEPVKLNIWANNMEFKDCPFETEAECKIWKAKPIVSETVSNRTPMVSPSVIDGLIALASAGKEITSDMEDAKPLVDRYKALLAASRACCSSGLAYKLQEAGASDGLVYKFMVDDANFYQFGERCLVTTDDDLDEFYTNTSTAEMVADVRNGCLCRRKEYFSTLLSPFIQVAEAEPSFAKSAFYWKYTDGLKRTITVSINQDVNTVLSQLANCPD